MQHRLRVIDGDAVSGQLAENWQGTPPYSDLYHQLHGRSIPAKIIHGESNAGLFSDARGFMNGFDKTMQLQVGCPGGCLFCYVSVSFRMAPSDVQRRWGFEVRNKRDVAAKLRKALQSGELAGQTLYWSGVTDAYASPPAVTRDVWQVLNDAPAQLRPRRIALQTRFRPDRDASRIAAYARSTCPSDAGPAVVVSYSVGTDRNDLIRAWERATPCFESRLHAIETLCASGIFVVATLSPLGPWSNLRSALERLRACGVAYLTTLFFKEHTGPTTTPRPFLDYLHREYPQLLDAAWQADRVQEMESVFGHGRVIVGKAGFSSLARPQDVLNRPATESKP